MVSYRVNTLNLNIWRSPTRLWAFDRKQQHLLSVMPSWVSISLHWRCFVIKRGDVSRIYKDLWWWQSWWLIFEFKGQIRPHGKDVGNMETACTVNRPLDGETNFIDFYSWSWHTKRLFTGVVPMLLNWTRIIFALEVVYEETCRLHTSLSPRSSVIENPRFCGVSLQSKKTPDSYKSQASRGRGLYFGCQSAISRTIFRCIS